MAATNRRQLLTGAAAYAAGAAIVAGGAALASEARGAAIDHKLAELIQRARDADRRAKDQEAIAEIHRGRSGFDEALNLSYELADACADALDEVAGHPVSTAADLSIKLAFMREYGLGDGRDWLATINQDVDRITVAGA